MKMLTFVCKKCGAEAQEDTIIPFHLGPSGQTLCRGKLTGDILCDYCQETLFKAEETAYNESNDGYGGD